MKALLTPDQVAGILHLSRRKVLCLEIPKIRVGDGRGKVLFEEDHVSEYLKSRTEYPTSKGGHNVNGVQKKPTKIGVSILPSRQVLEEIRLQHSGGSQERRGGT